MQMPVESPGQPLAHRGSAPDKVIARSCHVGFDCVARKNYRIDRRKNQRPARYLAGRPFLKYRSQTHPGQCPERDRN